MKKFVLSLLGLTLLVGASVVSTYAVMVFRYQPKLKNIYTVRPDQDVLFIGSSEMGCGVRHSPQYHHRLIWYMTSTFPTFEIHLRELEQRGQLDGVKLLIMTLNNRSLVQLEEENLQRIWHRALPLYWRYWREYPCGRWSFLCFALNHLQDVLSFSCADSESNRFAITKLPPKEYAAYVEETAQCARRRSAENRIPEWEGLLYRSLKKCKDIADRHHIKMITVRMPVMQAETDNLNAAEQERYDKLLAYSKSLGIDDVDLGVFPDCYFMDTVHLTEEGSDVFMHRLYERLGLKIHTRGSGVSPLE